MTKKALLRAFAHLWVARAIVRIGGQGPLAIPDTVDVLQYHLDEAQKALVS